MHGQSRWETVALLEQVWRVLAIDAELEAERRLRARVVPSLVSRLTVVTARFSDVQLPSCDLVWAGLALPFCPADAFEDVWRRIRQAVMPGGVLAVDLFGPIDVAGDSDCVDRQYLSIRTNRMEQRPRGPRPLSLTPARARRRVACAKPTVRRRARV